MLCNECESIMEVPGEAFTLSSLQFYFYAFGFDPLFFALISLGKTLLLHTSDKTLTLLFFALISSDLH